MYKILYFIYVALTSVKHWNKLSSFSNFYSQKYKRSKWAVLLMAYKEYFKHGFHPIDYFYLGVYGNKEFNSPEYANKLYMYKFEKQLNKKAFVKYFLDKRLFNQHFKGFMGHKSIHLKETSLIELEEWINNSNSKQLMIKKAKGLAGIGIKKLRIERQNGDTYVGSKLLKDVFPSMKKYDILEEYVEQHEKINKLNPSCLNTIRIVTVIDKFNQVNVIGAVIRLGVENDIDNFSAGGIAVNIDTEKGCLIGEGFKLVPAEPMSFKEHPITQVVLDGYVLPNWELLVSTVKKAALVFPEAKSIGWDVAITPNGVSLIEGNHNWGQVLLEKSLRRGIKKDLEACL